MKKVVLLILVLKCNFLYAQWDHYRSISDNYIAQIKPDSILRIIKEYENNTNKQLLDPAYFLKSKNVTDSVKSRLLILLKKTFLSDEQIKFKVGNEFKNSFEFVSMWPIIDTTFQRSKAAFAQSFIETRIKSKSDSLITLSKKYGEIYDSVYHYIYDSVTLAFKKDWTKKLKDSILPIGDEIVLSAATAKIKEAIPILTASLLNPKSPYKKETAELALAILGDSIYQRKYFRLHREYIHKDKWVSEEFKKDARNLFLINTQKSIGLLNDWMDTSKVYSSYEEGFGNNPSEKYYFSALLVPDLFKFVKDLPTREEIMKLPENQPELKSPNYILYFEVSTEQILFMKSWMLSNKGKYILDN